MIDHLLRRSVDNKAMHENVSLADFGFGINGMRFSLAVPLVNRDRGIILGVNDREISLSKRYQFDKTRRKVALVSLGQNQGGWLEVTTTLASFDKSDTGGPVRIYLKKTDPRRKTMTGRRNKVTTISAVLLHNESQITQTYSNDNG